LDPSNSMDDRARGQGSTKDGLFEAGRPRSDVEKLSWDPRGALIGERREQDVAQSR
jgi:hypothetical protein